MLSNTCKQEQRKTLLEQIWMTPAAFKTADKVKKKNIWNRAASLQKFSPTNRMVREVALKRKVMFRKKLFRPSSLCAMPDWMLYPIRLALLDIRFLSSNLGSMAKTILTPFNFCLRPSAKDQGITWVLLVLVVVHHLAHFLFKRNLSCTNLPDLELNRGPSVPQL